MKLISMTDFILQTKNDFVYSENAKYEENFKQIVNYAEFLKQPLTLGMFIPVDKHGNITEPLKGCCSGADCGCMGMPVNVSSREEMDEVLEAESRVFFKGFRLMEGGLPCTVINDDGKRFYLGGVYNHTIEDKISHKLELTESALKQIGLNP